MRQQPAQNVGGGGGGATNLAAAAALRDRLSSSCGLCNWISEVTQ